MTALGGVIAASGVATLLNTVLLHPQDAHETLLRSTGGLLQCLGLVRGLFAVDEKVSKVWGTPRLLEWTRQEARRLFQQAKFRVYSWFGWTKDVSSTTTFYADTGAHESGFEGDARLSVRPSKDADNRCWIEYLDEEVEALKDRLNEVRRAHADRMDEIEAQMKADRQRLRAAIDDTEDLVERLAIGGFEWELVSLFWFLFGVVAATWAAPLSDWLLGG